ncbi:hypothetical protein GCM10010121_029820 [Streptomyces brasiliensis]|uniref:Uncharacterized protein n=1 Tax=Streptomyces brasiliensis TaxID=1954 RepID=A0A917KJV1_9ACTN|nr:hypothetical protein GCM10010121_029820 [Streptomyces brasiliensis]
MPRTGCTTPNGRRTARMSGVARDAGHAGPGSGGMPMRGRGSVGVGGVLRRCRRWPARCRRAVSGLPGAGGRTGSGARPTPGRISGHGAGSSPWTSAAPRDTECDGSGERRPQYRVTKAVASRTKCPASTALYGQLGGKTPVGCAQRL